MSLMKWVNFCGSWRLMREHIEEDVRARVREVMGRGDGLILQGVLGVDAIALDEALKIDRLARRIKVFIPASKEDYYNYYRAGMKKGVVPMDQSSELIIQLFLLYRTNTEAIVEVCKTCKVNRESLEERTKIVFESADEVEAFIIYKNENLRGALEIAEKRGINVHKSIYDLP
jgi:hypothetical protein